ncbi:MAG: penicillin acylase family protein [Pseudomonadota bacterium]
MRLLTVSASLAAVLAALSAAAWFGIEPLVRQQTADSIDPPAGTLTVAGPSAPVSIRRDAYGVPLVEARNVDDLAFGAGYAMAQDRLPQMVSMAFTAQGRLAELAGDMALPLDRYLRTLGVHRIAQAHYAQVPPELQRRLQLFSDGVNAYADAHRDRLPLPLRASGMPEPWTPLHSMDLYVLLELALGMNLHQETAYLSLAARVGPQKAAWLLPTMPDEPLPFAEAGKLGDIDFAALAPADARVAVLDDALRAALLPAGMAASNNWVIAPQRTARGASILANDTHLLLQHPPLWMAIQLRAPGYQAAGVALAGIPGVVAGYNGRVAWGMTMVMADSQDLFVEQLEIRDGKTLYRAGDDWLPVSEREELIRVRGRAEPERLVVRSTRHGPLLDDVLRDPWLAPLQPVAGELPRRYGYALAWSAETPDASLAAMWELAAAQDIGQAQDAARNIRYIHLNVVFADRGNIGWQVTGRYPQRRAGTGKLPSPGWSGDYDWNGFVDIARQPARVNPPAGFIGTANDRKVPPGHPVQLSSSWFYPERGERIDALLAARNDHRGDDSVRMQADQLNLFALKLQRVLLADPLAGELRAAIGRLPPADSLLAMEAHAALTGWDGEQRADSRPAAIFGLFEDALPRLAFGDELGSGENDGAGSAAWRALVADTETSYSAAQDHLLGRADSPFWDDVSTTGHRETKAEIVARTLVAAMQRAEAAFGRDRAGWQWGKLHVYHWRSAATQAREHLSWPERFVVDRLAGYLDRGPYPAGGSHNTLNVGGYPVGGGEFAVAVVPAMRMVVDFADPEPLRLVIAGGQSADPASRHYDDGIALYLSTQNRVMPFNDAAARARHFADEFVLRPP